MSKVNLKLSSSPVIVNWKPFETRTMVSSMGLRRNLSMRDTEATLGQSIPRDTQHAVSVSLPTWRANVGYEEGEDWVVNKMTTGYPRFFIHKTIQGLAITLLHAHGRTGELAMLFPSHKAAHRCVQFLRRLAPFSSSDNARVLDFVPNIAGYDQGDYVMLNMSAVYYQPCHSSLAKAFWQHTGEGISSRRAQHCAKLTQDGLLVRRESGEMPLKPCKGPKRYREKPFRPELPANDTVTPKSNGDGDPHDSGYFVEERFGRNLDLGLASQAKVAIKRRICGCLKEDFGSTTAISTYKSSDGARNVVGVSEDDVFLYPTGMNSIFHTHRTLMAARGEMKSICFGFPYIDTLKLLEKFGPGCLFYGHGSSEDLDDLETRLENGDKFLALFCEFPSNPLLRSPDLHRIWSLAEKYDFAVVVDETVGNFLNTHVLPYADVVVSSLTKIFSGDSNVMGGSIILNPKGRYYQLLCRIWPVEYEDNYWPEDAVFMERNSRDFVSRSERINMNAEAICDVLKSHPKVKEVYYPKYNPTRHLYDRLRNVKGGYGGLLSATFFSPADAAEFYDNLETEKGPSLGTNFTLASPFVLLAHYNELEWAASFGVDPNLVRFSVGLEDTDVILLKFRIALDSINST